MSRAPITPGSPDTAEDIRLEMAAAASASERRNRPLLLVAGAALLLMVASIYTIRDAVAYAGARGTIAEERERSRKIDDLTAQIKSLTEGQTTEIREPDPAVPSKLERLAASCGVPARPGFDIRSESPAASEGVSQKRYTATIKGASSQSLMDWLVQATGQNDAGLTGLELNMIKVGPNKGQGDGVGWDAEVRLTRIERGS